MTFIWLNLTSYMLRLTQLAPHYFLIHVIFFFCSAFFFILYLVYFLRVCLNCTCGCVLWVQFLWLETFVVAEFVCWVFSDEIAVMVEFLGRNWWWIELLVCKKKRKFRNLRVLWLCFYLWILDNLFAFIPVGWGDWNCGFIALNGLQYFYYVTYVA